MITVDYNIKPKVITTRNPQANAIIERVNQTIGNVLRTFDVNKTVLDSDDPWSSIPQLQVSQYETLYILRY